MRSSESILGEKFNVLDMHAFTDALRDENNDNLADIIDDLCIGRGIYPSIEHENLNWYTWKISAYEQEWVLDNTDNRVIPVNNCYYTHSKGFITQKHTRDDGLIVRYCRGIQIYKSIIIFKGFNNAMDFFIKESIPIIIKEKLC